MGFEKHLRILDIALTVLVVLSLGTNILLYLQVQSIREERNFLGTKLADLEADIANLTVQLWETQRSASKTIHTRKLVWGRQNIPARTIVEGYVADWTVEEAVRIEYIEVWMGNPYDILWEGDTIVTVNNTIDPWNPPPDTELVHYQFDSHYKSSVPHQKSFDLKSGFHIDAGKTVYVYRLFNHFDEKETESGDGWVMFYYTLE